MNNPISFELAKLLKEKGFDRPCYHYYYNNKLDSSSKDNWNTLTGYSAPTIAEVVMWLYEKHGEFITLYPYDEFREDLFSFYIIKRSGNYRDKFPFKSPTEAYEAAIEYALKNLIYETT